VTDAAPLLVERDGAVLIATLNRPDKLNAMNGPMMSSFEHTLHAFRDDPALRVLLVRATGRFFSAGADLREGSPPSASAGGSELREMHRRGLNGMHRIYDEMEAIEKPIVVAHQAKCLGGGLELSLSCDFRLAASGATYGFPEGLFGMIPASNGVSRLTRIVGTHWARYLIMANREVRADRALAIGLVHEVFPDATFEADTLEFCRHLTRQNPQQMGLAKLAIEMARDLGLAQARNVERMGNAALMMEPSYREGVAKYLQGVGSTPSSQ
jgi:enoyl-CoA hydratase/carnithine racemase